MLKQNDAGAGVVAHKTLRSGKVRQSWLMIALALLSCAGFMGTAAAVSSSDHYQVTETQFGSGSSLESCSDSYCAQSSTGDTTVGRSDSDSYGALNGSNSTADPLLEVSTDGGNEDLGTLSPFSTATVTMVVSVRSYVTSGYTMQITGAPPSYGANQLARLTTPTTSHAGAEQFGINLVANTAPAVGADPVQVPSDETSFGVVTDNYNVPDLFMYEEGDIVAESATQSGQTDYTVSMILNISNLTKSGRYASVFSAVVVPYY